MGRKTFKDPSVVTSVYIPNSIISKVRILLLDPSTGKVKHGSISNLVSRLLSEWLNNVRKDSFREGINYFYVQEKEFNIKGKPAWWAELNKGYTSEILYAGKYTEEEIKSLYDSKHDKIWSVEFINDKVNKNMKATGNYEITLEDLCTEEEISFEDLNNE